MIVWTRKWGGKDKLGVKITRNDIAELIERQNKYLHNNFVILVVDGGDGEDQFSPENDGTNYDGSLHQWAMTARKQDNTFYLIW